MNPAVKLAREVSSRRRFWVSTRCISLRRCSLSRHSRTSCRVFAMPSKDTFTSLSISGRNPQKAQTAKQKYFSLYGAMGMPVFDKTGIMLLLKSLWYLVFQHLVRPNLIVEPNIAYPLRYPFFWGCSEKGDSDCVVMQAAVTENAGLTVPAACVSALITGRTFYAPVPAAFHSQSSQWMGIPVLTCPHIVGDGTIWVVKPPSSFRASRMSG